MTTNGLTHTAAQYFASIQNSALINQVPEVFLEQAMQSEDCYISAEMLQQRLFSITITDAVPTPEGITAKLSLFAIFNPTTGEVRPQTDSNATGFPEGFIALPGFKSMPIAFTNNEVVDGIISSTELEYLKEYAQKWQAGLNESANERHWYEPANTKFRMYFTYKSPSSELRFVPEGRINPRTNEAAIGMGQLLIQDLKLIGSGVNSSTTTLRSRSQRTTDAAVVANPLPNSTYVPKGATAPAPSRAGRFKFN